MMAMVWVLSQKFVESNNKDIWNYLKSLSRKINPVAQMTDVMSRLLERSVKFCRPKLAVGFVRSSFLEGTLNRIPNFGNPTATRV